MDLTEEKDLTKNGDNIKQNCNCEYTFVLFVNYLIKTENIETKMFNVKIL